MNTFHSFIHSVCCDMQETKLLKLGLLKKYNTALPIFPLKINCGWKEKQSFENSEIPKMDLNLIEEIVYLNSTMINKFLNNEVDQKYLNGINTLLNLQIKGIELVSIEKRMENIEAKMKIILTE